MVDLYFLEVVESGGRMLKRCVKEGELATGWFCFVIVVIVGTGVVGGLMFWVWFMAELLSIPRG